tara:strand:- start:3 stop:773 length:771 start_codon:yes stop_codon:yes gene_type:complete
MCLDCDDNLGFSTSAGAQGATGASGSNGTNGTNGTNGAAGASAYDQWITAGNSGTEADFLTSLAGTNGTNGTNSSPLIYSVANTVSPYKTANTGAWETLHSYTLVSGDITGVIGDFLDMNIKLLSSAEPVEGNPATFFRVVYVNTASIGHNIKNSQWNINGELIGMYGNANAAGPNAYNVNLKFYNASATSTQVMCDWSSTKAYQGDSWTPLASAIHPLGLDGQELEVGGVFNFQVYQAVAETTKIHVISIKSEKQ